MRFYTFSLFRYLSIVCIALAIPGYAIGQATAPLAKNHSKFLGNIIPHFVPAQYTQLWNQLTPENAGKWGSIESTRNTMSWGNLDRAYKLAYDNGQKFRYHTFVWGSQEPGWLKNITPAQQLVELEEFMSQVAQRYPVIHYIDVVNEPLHAPSSMREALGGNGATGWDCDQNPVEDENRQYERYRDKFPVFWEHEGVAGITLWGYIEGTTWAVGSGLMNANGTERKALTWLRQYMASEKSQVANKFLVTSVEISDEEPEVVVFPNPATGYLYVNARTATAAELFDQSGRVLFRITDFTNKVDVENLPAGVYLLKVTTPGGISTQKILIQ